MATISFTYDPNELNDTDEDDLSVMWYDEENDWYHILDQESIVNKTDHTVSVTTTHFSKYMLVDSKKWYQKWKKQVEYQYRNTNGFHFAFVVDVSGSMQGDRINKAKEALNSFADQFTENDTKSLITFNTSAQICSYQYNTVAHFKQAVSSLVANGGTEVSEGLSLGASDLYGRGNTKEKILILLCDGDVNDCSSVVNYCVDHNITIYAINVVGSDSAALQIITESTGGEYYNAQSASDIGRIMQHITVDIDKTDSDEDGLPDILEEQGMLTVNGRVFTSSPETKHSDNDGISDGEEMGVRYGERLEDYVRVKYEYIGYGESAYCFYFDATSDPSETDSDSDNLSDKIDPYPLSYNTFYNYDRKEAINYAHKYAAEPNTSNYYYFKNGDCANFVSQCLHAGGIEMSKEWNFFYQGYHIPGNHWLFEDYTLTWTTAYSQYKYFLNNLNISTGEVIVFNSKADMEQKLENGTYDIEPGDLMYFQTPNRTYPTHATIIDSVSTTITFSAHTKNRENTSINEFWNSNNGGKVYIVHLRGFVITS